jgi:Flp pilus assembly protein TadD
MQEVLKTKPDNVEAHFVMGVALEKQGNITEAISHYHHAINGEQTAILPLNNLAWILATHPNPSIRDGTQAIKLAQEAERISGGQNPTILDTLAAAYAEAGRFEEATETARRALALSAAQQSAALSAALRERLRLYQAGTPYHSAPP